MIININSVGIGIIAFLVTTVMASPAVQADIGSRIQQAQHQALTAAPVAASQVQKPFKFTTECISDVGPIFMDGYYTAHIDVFHGDPYNFTCPSTTSTLLL